MKFTDNETNIKCKNYINKTVFGHGDSCFIVLSTWPYTEKGTLLLEKTLFNKTR